MQRIAVVGNSGSGKSTLAKALATRLDIDHTEIDAIYHQADWQPLAEPEFVARIDSATAGERWVVDGNYSAVRGLIWARADTIVWLDLSRPAVMRQIVWRTLRRVGQRQELWNGNRERWRNFFSLDPKVSVIAWSWHRHSTYRDRYGAAMTDPANAHLTFVRLRSRADVRALLASF
jgi:adenylate kinase family enzyme